MSITNNKNRNPLLNLLISCISASSATRILSLKEEYTFRFFNFLIIDLCNSSANSLLDTISFLTSPLEFFTKFYKLLKQVHVDIHHILDVFSNIKCFIT